MIIYLLFVCLLLPLVCQASEPQQLAEKQKTIAANLKKVKPTGEAQALISLYKKLPKTSLDKISDKILEKKVKRIDMEIQNILQTLPSFFHHFVDFYNFMKANPKENKEPEQFVNLIRRFKDFFGPQTIQTLRTLITELNDYGKHNKNTISVADKKIVYEFLRNVSHFLATLAIEVNFLHDANKNALQAISWEGKLIPAPENLPKGPKFAIDWINWNVLMPLKNNAQAEQVQSSNLNSSIIKKSLKIYKVKEQNVSKTKAQTSK